MKLVWISGRKNEGKIFLKFFDDFDPKRLNEKVEIAQNSRLMLGQLNLKC